MAESTTNTKVCVTAGAGFLGSSLVEKLLQKGYTVHATSRNLAAQANISVLKALPGAESRLRLFEADMCDANSIQLAIQGCLCVVHMATPFTHTLHGFKHMSEAAIAGVKTIADACIRSGSVKRLIYTGSVVAASPLKDNSGCLYEDSVDESCWTPLGCELPLADTSLLQYARSKTLAEKEVLKYNDSGEIAVVSLTTALVGGDTVLSYLPDSMKVLMSQVTGDENWYKVLRFIEELLGKVPIAHVEDVCNAHIYCIENPSIMGRFLCANGYLKTSEIADYCVNRYPSIHIPQRLIEDTKRSIQWGSTKLLDAGFQYKYDTGETLNHTIKCAIRMGEVTQGSG